MSPVEGEGTTVRQEERMTRLVISAALGVLACNGASERPPSGTGTPQALPTAREGAVELRQLLQEHNSGLRDSTRRVITDAATLAATWRQVYEGRGPLPPQVPSIDFDREMVVVATMGTQRSGGYTVYIDSAKVAGNAMLVYVRSVLPGPTCGATAALTEPTVMVAVPRVTTVPQFVEVVERTNCG
jgi:hypothetical protein